MNPHISLSETNLFFLMLDLLLQMYDTVFKDYLSYGRHDIAEILLKVALNTETQINLFMI